MSLDLAGRVRVGAFTAQVDLSVADGEVVVLLGPNGAGKSTVLRTVAGLVPLLSGELAAGGVVWDHPDRKVFVPPERRSVGVVFQDYVLFPHLSVLENVAYGLRARRQRRAAAHALAGEWLERVGLADRMHAKPRELSGGQAQRVALARALAPAPLVLLLDEPLSALDVHTRAGLRRELVSHLRAFPGPRLVVTHDPVEAAILGDRLVIIEDGAVVQEGSAGEVRARPATPYVADLAGVNLYRGVADGTSSSVALEGGGHIVGVEVHSGLVLVTIHPSAIALHAARPEGTPRNVWEGTVVAIEGDERRARVEIAGVPPVVAEVTAGAVAELGLVGGSKVWVAVKATEVSIVPA